MRNIVQARFGRWLFAGCLVLAGLGWAAQPGVDWNNPVFTEDYVPGELLVGFKGGVAPNDALTIHKQIGAEVIEQFSIVPVAHVRLPSRLSMVQAAKQYAANPAVRYVEPNYIVRPVDTVPNDPSYPDLWGMERIHAPAAWDVAVGSHDIVVGIIDTGILTTHQDLADNIAPGGYDFANDTVNQVDNVGHGTHVAGTIGAVGNNGLGVVGVNWQVKMIPLKFLDPFGSTADAIRAVEYAATNTALKIKITNNSWGGGGYSQGLYDAIKAAGETYGQLFIAAAGNDAEDNDTTPHYPSSYDLPNLIAVAAIGEDGSLADFSNYGLESVHLAAPGVDILSTVPGGIGDQLDTYSGTSMATPHVTGAAALLWSIHPDYTYDVIRDAILDSAAPNPNLDGKVITGGELDLAAAIAALGPQITLDRQAYRSDATAQITVVDPTLPAPLPTEITADAVVRDPAAADRWSGPVTLPQDNGNIYTGALALVSGTMAVDGDTLTVSYTSPDSKTASRTVPIDDTPPVIQNVQLVEVSEDSATISWTTDEPADTRYILATAIPPGGLGTLPEVGGGVYVSDPSVSGGVTQYVHTVTVPVVQATKYFLAAISEDYAGNQASAPADLSSLNEEDYLTFVTRARRVVYFNDMESGAAGWTVSNLHGTACWQYGPPTFGPLQAYSGQRVWGTVLDGNYPDLAQASVFATPVAVELSPRLDFMSWHQFATGDFGVVEVNAGAGWVNVSGLLEGSSAGWQPVRIDLPAFSNRTIQVRFRIESDSQENAAGWYIDDVQISHVETPGINLLDYTVDDTTGGDGDGYPEPGESFNLVLTVYNSMQAVIYTNVQALVTVPNPAVELSPPTAVVSYGNLRPGDQADSGTQLTLTAQPDVIPGTAFTVFHSATADGGQGPFDDTLTVSIVTRESVSGTVTNLFTGVPIADASVRGAAAGYPDVTATTDAGGQYILHGLVPGVTYAIRAWKPGEYSPSDPQSASGPAVGVDFGLGLAYANPSPAAYDFAVNEGGNVFTNLALDNTAGNLPLAFRIQVEYSPHSAMTTVPAWLELAVDSGDVPAGGTAAIDVTADSARLVASEVPYEATLRLISNDIGGEDILIPVTLLVTAQPVLYVHSVRVLGGDGDAYPEPGETVDLDIRLGNSGSEFAFMLDSGVAYTGAGTTALSQSNVFWLYVLPGGVESPLVEPPLFAYPQVALDPALTAGDVLPFTLHITDAEARETTLTFALTVTVRHAISGNVHDLLTATPVEGAQVTATGAGFSGQALSDAAGDYAIYDLTNGTYEVHVLPPAPYGAPPSTNAVIADANADNVDFAVAAWSISTQPSNLTVNLREGQSSNLTLTLRNEGPYDGFVDVAIELVEGLPHNRVGVLDQPAVDWAALTPAEAVPREMLVRFEDGAAPQAQASALAAVGATVVHRYHAVPAAHIRVPGNLSMEWIANRLASDAAIRYVEPNYRRQFYARPDDPLYPELYGLHNERQTGGTLGEDIRAEEAWDVTVGNTNVIIAIMDTGVKLDHVDLAANLVPGYDFGDNDNDPSPDPVSNSEHGTHVAGTVGAVGDNGIGVAGVNWHSRIMPLKVATIVTNLLGIEEAGLSSDAILAALEYAVTNGVKISNHSYGGPEFSGVEYEMIAYAQANDHLFVAAAGNEGTSNDDGAPLPSYPASYNLDNIISVAAADHDGQLAYFSNYGSNSVDIAAPGVDILSTYLYSDLDGYEKLSGTSMASPHVAGVAGLLKSIAPWASYAMLREAILLGARHDPVLAGKVASAGHLDAAGALELIQAFWLQVTPMQGNIASLGTLPLAVQINASGQLPAGTYVAHIRVRGGANELAIPVTVNVAPAPVPVLAGVTVNDLTTGDGDGYGEPNETVELFIQLANDGSALYASPTGTLSSSTPGVVLLQNTAAWPSIASGDRQTNSTGFRVQLPNASGDATFALALPGPWVLTFTLPVAPRYTISGTVRDAQTAAGLGGLTVEYWGAGGGRVTTASNGTYRINGLENGTYRCRVLGVSHEKSAVAVRSISGGNQTLNFALRRPVVDWGPTQLVFAAQSGQQQEQNLVLTNTAADAFDFRIVTAAPKKIGLISDKAALASLKPVLQQPGWETTLWTNNLVLAGDVLSGRYTTNAEVIMPQDLVILDLGGTVGTGRLLSEAEETLLNSYLAQGGKLMVVGANVLSRPDDRRLRDLVGADSLSRAATTASLATLDQVLPIDTNWVAISVGDRVAVAPTAYDEATPNPTSAPTVYFSANGSSKIMRRTLAGGGVVILWNGNKDAGEWQARGAWQDVLQGLVENELRESPAWLSVSPGSASVSNGTLAVTVRAESTGLTIGTHQAMLMVRGNYPGQDVRTIPVSFDVVQPTLRAQSTTGVKDWMDRYLAGAGGADASLFQLIYAGPDGIAQAPLADGSATGDDVILNTFPFNKDFGRIGVGYEWLPELGQFNEIFHHDLQGTTPVRNVYVRAWDAAAFADSVAYGDSALYALNLAAYETHDFGTWIVNRVLGYPGPLSLLQDSNGDSIPDGYYVRIGMDPRAPIAPLAAAWTLQQKAGSYGTASNQFNFPTRLFLADPFVFVLDRQNARISVWNRSSLTPVRTYGTSGSAAGQFASPYGLGKAPNANRFAVADSGNHRIQVFAFNPTTGAISFERQFGSYGTGAGQFNNPRAVAIDSLGRLYVADKDNHRIQVFDSTGTHLFSFGAFGTANGQMKSPQGIAVDASGIIYVADTENNRLQGFTGAGVYLWKTGTAGTGLGQFNKPLGIQLGLSNRIYVADTSNHRIQVLDANRTPVGILGSQGAGDGQVSFPHDVAPDLASAIVYVADTWNHRLQKLETVLDGDGDGMDDTWELLNGLDPANPADALLDTDHDGLLNIGEYRIRTNPQQADTDGDGVPDGQEVALAGDPGDAANFPLVVGSLTSKPYALGWIGASGRVYAVQASTNLPVGHWQVVPGSVATAAMNGAMTYTNAATNRLQFFRPVQYP